MAKRRAPCAEIAERDQDIRELRRDGRTVPQLVRLTGLDSRTIRRICEGVVPRLGRGPVPAGEVRQDRRRNGRLYDPWQPTASDPTDQLDLDDEQATHAVA